jgi:hypothetical protein
MKHVVLVVLLVLLAGSASALEFSKSSYIVVVGKDASATDVVVAANFAASMKGFTGVTFESAIDEEAYNNLPDLAGRTIVVIDGAQKQVRITPTTTGDAASAYFRQQGFTVIDLESRSQLLVKPPKVEEKKIAVALVPPENDSADIEEDVVQETAPVQEEQMPQEQPPALQVVPETTQKPGITTRIWRWITSWF